MGSVSSVVVGFSYHDIDLRSTLEMSLLTPTKSAVYASDSNLGIYSICAKITTAQVTAN